MVDKRRSGDERAVEERDRVIRAAACALERALGAAARTVFYEGGSPPLILAEKVLPGTLYDLVERLANNSLVDNAFLGSLPVLPDPTCLMVAALGWPGEWAGEAAGELERLGGQEDERRRVLQLVDALSPRLIELARISLAIEETGRAELSGLLARVTKLVRSATTRTDLIEGSLAALQELDGVRSVAFVRPDQQGRLLYEFAEGNVLGSAHIQGEVYPISIKGDLPSGQGPAGRAWRSGEVMSSPNIADDPTMRPWAELYSRLGIHSSMVVPVRDRAGEVFALINLYSPTPAFFEAPWRRSGIAHVADLLGMGLVATAYPNVTKLSDRLHHQHLVRQGSVDMLFQPIIDLRTGLLDKFEALARLDDQGELISPGVFLPSLGAEDFFLLFQIAMRQSAEALASWKAEGVLAGVAVNAPADALSDARYADLVASSVNAGDFDPGDLTVEITEDAHGIASEVFSEHLALLGETGVGLSQDDLGSGYSSLLRLDQMPFTEVKIDQGLVRNTKHPEKSLRLVYHLSQLGDELGIDVVAEGLETPGLLEMATILGARFGQGYAIAKPMHPWELVGWAKSYRRAPAISHPHTAFGGLALLYRWAEDLKRARTYFDKPRVDDVRGRIAWGLEALTALSPRDLAMITSKMCELGEIDDELFAAIGELSSEMSRVVAAERMAEASPA